MDKLSHYYIMSFATTADAIQAECYAKGKIDAVIMPVPHEIKSGCGLALRFTETEKESIFTFCKNTPFTGQLYKLETRRVNGRRPVEQIKL